jgi:hypothetical protein
VYESLVHAISLSLDQSLTDSLSRSLFARVNPGCVDVAINRTFTALFRIDPNNGCCTRSQLFGTDEGELVIHGLENIGSNQLAMFGSVIGKRVYTLSDAGMDEIVSLQLDFGEQTPFVCLLWADTYQVQTCLTFLGSTVNMVYVTGVQKYNTDSLLATVQWVITEPEFVNPPAW